MAFRYTSLKTYGRPGDLQKVCNDYFRECERDDETPTMSGLGLKVSASVKTLMDWSKLPEYGPILDEAFARIENHYERELVSSSRRTDGIQYALDNRFGWKERREYELGGETRAAVAQALPLAEKLKIIEQSQRSMLEVQQRMALMQAAQKAPVVVDVDEAEDVDGGE
mgnify:CR=1 FL=1